MKVYKIGIFKWVLKDSSIKLSTKKAEDQRTDARYIKYLFTMYGCESWTVKKAER